MDFTRVREGLQPLTTCMKAYLIKEKKTVMDSNFIQKLALESLEFSKMEFFQKQKDRDQFHI